MPLCSRPLNADYRLLTQRSHPIVGGRRRQVDLIVMATNELMHSSKAARRRDVTFPTC